jgi:2,3-dihydroxybenzoate decarboxylase
MRKIALEEHFARPELSQCSESSRSSPVIERLQDRLLDFGAMRLETMDKAAIELAVLSVTTPGVQGEPDAKVAITPAHVENDFLAREMTKYPSRFVGFTHLPLQDANAAADELSRCVPRRIARRNPSILRRFPTRPAPRSAMALRDICYAFSATTTAGSRL